MTLIDRVGRQYGRLTVTARAENRGRCVRWCCRCVCGATTVVDGLHLTRGRIRSCGCLRREIVRTRHPNLTHGETRGDRETAEYRTWSDIIQRCENPKRQNWKNYGGRGITMCRRWRESFLAFIADVGRRPSPELTIDRIDNDGHYELGNIRWATRLQQRQNQRVRRVGCSFQVSE